MSYYDDGFMWRPYVSQAQRKAKAANEATKLRKKGHACCPVVVEGRKLGRTFWGEAWCNNLEAYSDFANRLPRGRTYVRNGSVFDLQINKGRIEARVSGSEIYTVDVDIKPVDKKKWSALVASCTGQINSVVELLQGKLAKGVMEILCTQKGGLFPTPSEMKFTCSCPDWAGMCKHVAATLYGVGCRLDSQPDLLFELRGVDQMDLVSHASGKALTGKKVAAKERVLEAGSLGEVFGIELDTGKASSRPRKPSARTKAAKAPARKPAARKTVKRVTSRARTTAG